MTTRTRLWVLALGLLTAGSASASTLTVYAKMSGTNAVGVVTTAAGSDASASINCATNNPTPATCVDTSVTGTVILEPSALAPAANATLVKWAGCASVAGQQCTVDLATSKTVTAYFSAANQQLTVKTYPVQAFAADGTTVTYTPPFGGKVTAPTTPAIDCKTSYATSVNCQADVAYGTSVVLTAVPAPGSKVTSWSGCASSTATTCTVAMNAAKVASATFGSAYAYTVTGGVTGPGHISITDSDAPDQMLCPSDCTAGVNVPTGSTPQLTIVAIPDAGAVFAGWAGLCAGQTSATCNVSAAALASATNRTVSALFKGAAGGACGGCHGQPVSHLPYDANCGACHTGYTASTSNPATHMNGAIEMTAQTCEQPPATFGVSFEIVGAGFVQNPGTTDDQAYVDAIVRFDGTPTDVKAAFTSGAWGSSGAPRLSIGEVLADGSFKSVLLTSATNSSGPDKVATSQTSSNAMWVLQDAGTSTYRFTFAAAGTSGVRPIDGLDLTKPYRAVMYGARYFTPAANPTITCASTQFPTSDYLDFSPTGTSSAFKATVTDAKCDACHGALNLHGRRRGVAICLTCHNPNTPLGSGNTDAFKWDLKNVAHKFHSGKNYDGINPMTGVQGTAWGTTLDATGVAQGPSHQTYFEGGGSATGPTIDDNVHQLPTQMQCTICHDTTKDNHLVASQAGCSSCHEINWVTGAGHGASYPTILPGETGHPHTDAECAGCHPTTGQIDTVWYTDGTPALYPVKEIHSALWDPITGYDFNLYKDALGAPLNTVNFSGTLYPGVPETRHQLDVTVTDFQVDGATGKATISFTVLLDGQPYQTLLAARTANLTANTFVSSDVLGGRFPTCAFTLAGPAETDYVVPATGSNNLSCGAADATDGSQVQAVDATLGQYKVTPTTNLNGATYAAGTYTLSYEMLYQRQAGNFDGTSGNDDDAIVRKPFAAKPKFYTVTKAAGAPPAWTFANGSPRRAVVSFDKCNNCHVQIGFHSNQGRQGPDYCAVCHNPKLDNATRIRALASATKTYPGFGTTKYYLPESVSLNVFIHRIHMGGELPSIQQPYQASPWVPEAGRIVYGALRGKASIPAPSDMTDLSEFAMPNPMGRCNGCHLDGTWALPTTGRAPVERTLKTCATTETAADGSVWCAATLAAGSTANQLPKGPLVVTPPLKAVCTSCHDDLATDKHADAMTTNPMTAGATESCADCHGAARPWDVVKMHPAIP